MHISNLTTQSIGDTRQSSARVAWEENDFPEQTLNFTIADGAGTAAAEPGADAFLADAFLTACFPLAAVHGEARVRIEGRPCPMLVEGLRTAHAWWTSWGGMPTPAPAIESPARKRGDARAAPPRAIACISGGVDGLHMLMRNHRLYRPDDPAYIRDALFIHGFDIGKRARDPEEARYRMALRRLEPIADETGVRIIACRTDLRHLPTQPGFWTYRHHGAALAAVAHAAARERGYLFIGGSYVVATPIPWGSHPAVDGLFSSQRLTVVHDGSRFSRLEKIRDLAEWPAALGALRVCSANIGSEANCGRCEKCLRTRLELLAAGVEETEAFGPSLTAARLWDAAVSGPIGDTALMYEDLLPSLRARGLREICRTLEDMVARYRERARQGERWPTR